jgi:hypothetical protein
MTRQLISANKQPSLREPHAKRPPQSGFVQVTLSESGFRDSNGHVTPLVKNESGPPWRRIIRIIPTIRLTGKVPEESCVSFYDHFPNISLSTSSLCFLDIQNRVYGRLYRLVVSIFPRMSPFSLIFPSAAI